MRDTAVHNELINQLLHRKLYLDPSLVSVLTYLVAVMQYFKAFSAVRQVLLILRFALLGRCFKTDAGNSSPLTVKIIRNLTNKTT